MTYVDILGHPTWISVGIENDQTVLLLHGGIVDSRSLLDSIGPALSERYRVRHSIVVDTGALPIRQTRFITTRWPMRLLVFLSI